MESFTSAIQTLITTNKDFPQKFKQRLVLESHNVTNPFEFMAGLITEGVLSNESSDMEASVDLKGIIVELAMMIVCSKGADAVQGLTKALVESGNLELVSSLRTWIKEDFAMETEGDISELKGAAAVPTGTSKKSGKKQVKNSTEMESNGAMFTDKIVSHMEDDFLEQLEGHWLGQAPKIVNVPEFCSSLAHQKVLDEREVQLKSGLELESKEEQRAQRVIKVAVSKKAIASLVLAFQLSRNDGILQETQAWLETSQMKKKNYPISVKALPKKLQNQKPTVGISQFFEQAPPSNDLQKVATFNCSPESFSKGKSSLKFNKEKMTACLAGGSVRTWNWRENEETTIKFGGKVKGLTVFHYDEEILVLGTATGIVHLFDAKTLDEKWSDRLGEPVHSLQIFESTLLVGTRKGNEDNLWSVEISRSDMQLRNRRPVTKFPNDTNYGLSFDEGYFFVYHSNVALINYFNSEENVRHFRGSCSLEAPAGMNTNTLNVVDLIGGTPFVVAGCQNGAIAIWYKFGDSRKRNQPFKTLHGHQEAIVDLSAISGHLLSVCEGGKLLMWSGHDLQNQHIKPVPRVLAENFHNVTSLVACERWFASTSAEDGTINIWALPDLWLRTG